MLGAGMPGRSGRTPAVALPWGSKSMRRVGRSAAASAAARLTAVVVFPTPPFWFTTLRTRAMYPPCFTWNVRLALAVRIARGDYKKRPLVLQPHDFARQHDALHSASRRRGTSTRGEDDGAARPDERPGEADGCAR